MTGEFLGGSHSYLVLTSSRIIVKIGPELKTKYKERCNIEAIRAITDTFDGSGACLC